jgi:hypothetical protein
MREAVMQLVFRDEIKQMHYRVYLEEVCGYDRHFAKASQQAEALLRTLNLWDDSK